MPVPFFRIMQGKVNVTARVGEGNISLNITDGVGSNADNATFEIDDKDGMIAPPKTGVELQIIGGYVDDFRDFGIFIVDQVTLRGWPQVIAVNAQSVGAKEALKQRRTESFEAPKYKTYGDVFGYVAGRNKLTLAMSAELKSEPLEYEAQAEENDSEFLTRIGDKIDASVSIKNKRLVAVKRGQGKSASGEKLPDIKVRRGFGGNLVSYSVVANDKPKHQTVKASSFDRHKIQRDQTDAPASAEGPDYIIRPPFQSTKEAEKAAKAKARDLRAAEGGATFVIDGLPSAMAEAKVIASGIRSLVDGEWRATTVTHSWSSSSAYTTSIECEKPGSGS